MDSLIHQTHKPRGGRQGEPFQEPERFWFSHHSPLPLTTTKDCPLSTGAPNPRKREREKFLSPSLSHMHACVRTCAHTHTHPTASYLFRWLRRARSGEGRGAPWDPSSVQTSLGIWVLTLPELEYSIHRLNSWRWPEFGLSSLLLRRPRSPGGLPFCSCLKAPSPRSALLLRTSSLQISDSSKMLPSSPQKPAF